MAGTAQRSALQTASLAAVTDKANAFASATSELLACCNIFESDPISEQKRSDALETALEAITEVTVEAASSTTLPSVVTGLLQQALQAEESEERNIVRP